MALVGGGRRRPPSDPLEQVRIRHRRRRVVREAEHCGGIVTIDLAAVRIGPQVVPSGGVLDQERRGASAVDAQDAVGGTAHHRRHGHGLAAVRVEDVLVPPPPGMERLEDGEFGVGGGLLLLLLPVVLSFVLPFVSVSVSVAASASARRAPQADLSRVSVRSRSQPAHEDLSRIEPSRVPQRVHIVAARRIPPFLPLGRGDAVVRLERGGAVGGVVLPRAGMGKVRRDVRGWVDSYGSASPARRTAEGFENVDGGGGGAGRKAGTVVPGKGREDDDARRGINRCKIQDRSRFLLLARPQFLLRPAGL
mmetsp:Transcript_42567/g.129169  ORF Transcript_42567/g.129169 Transcript_42567/m.129169 type:complete len:307 (+) Transcript_42567:1273-2193(+)